MDGPSCLLVGEFWTVAKSVSAGVRGHYIGRSLTPVGLENSVRWFELGLRLKRSGDQQLFLSAFK